MSAWLRTTLAGTGALVTEVNARLPFPRLTGRN
jgi:hypothetical protein